MRRILPLLAVLVAAEANAQAIYNSIQVQASSGEVGFNCVNSGCIMQFGNDTLQDNSGVLTWSGAFKASGTAESFATTVTAAGTTTLTKDSAATQQFTGTAAQTVQLPAATALTVGRKFEILNRSTGTVTVNDGSGSLALALPAKTQAAFRCTAVSTTAGTWDAVLPSIQGTQLPAFSGDVVTVAGSAVTTIVPGLTSTATAAGTTTLTATSTQVQLFTGTMTQTVALPDATTLKLDQPFVVINRSTGAVTVNDGAAGLVLTLPTNTWAVFRVTSIATAAGAWDVGGDLFAANWTKDGPTIRSLTDATQRVHLQGGATVEQSKTIQFEYTDGGEQGRLSMSSSGTLSTSIKDSVGTSCIGYQQQASGAVLLGGTLGDAGHPSVSVSNGFVQTRVSQNTSGGTFTAAFDCTAGNSFEVVAVTNGVVVTMGNPTGGTTGQRIAIKLKANTGVTVGTTVWGSLFKLAAWTDPAATFSRSIDFVFNGSNYVEAARTPADVPN